MLPLDGATYKRGDKHPTENYLFWCKYISYKGVPTGRWVTPDEFEKLKEKSRGYNSKYRKADAVYTLIKVYDYKGGELNVTPNLTKEGLASELSEYFENVFYEEDTLKDRDTIEKIVSDAMIKGEIQSEYAGGDGYTFEIYKAYRNQLTEVKFIEFREDIIKHIYKNWRNG